jgi:hypothetical protein
MTDWTLCRGHPLSETKEETTNNSLKAMDVGALTTLGTFACTDWRKMMMVNLDRLAPYEGTTWDEQQEQLKSKHCANRATGRKTIPSTDVASTALRKEMAVRL